MGQGKIEHESVSARKENWEEFLSDKHWNHLFHSTDLALFHPIYVCTLKYYTNGSGMKSTNFCTIIVYEYVKIHIKC